MYISIQWPSIVTEKVSSLFSPSAYKERNQSINILIRNTFVDINRWTNHRGCNILSLCVFRLLKPNIIKSKTNKNISVFWMRNEIDFTKQYLFSIWFLFSSQLCKAGGVSVRGGNRLTPSDILSRYLSNDTIILQYCNMLGIAKSCIAIFSLF